MTLDPAVTGTAPAKEADRRHGAGRAAGPSEPRRSARGSSFDLPLASNAATGAVTGQAELCHRARWRQVVLGTGSLPAAAITAF